MKRVQILGVGGAATVVLSMAATPSAMATDDFNISNQTAGSALSLAGSTSGAQVPVPIGLLSICSGTTFPSDGSFDQMVAGVQPLHDGGFTLDAGFSSSGCGGVQVSFGMALAGDQSSVLALNATDPSVFGIAYSCSLNSEAANSYIALVEGNNCTVYDIAAAQNRSAATRTSAATTFPGLAANHARVTSGAAQVLVAQHSASASGGDVTVELRNKKTGKLLGTKTTHVVVGHPKSVNVPVPRALAKVVKRKGNVDVVARVINEDHGKNHKATIFLHK